MRRAVFVMCMAAACVIWAGGTPLWAGEVDILIEKLVEKKILSASDAQEIVQEIRKESAKEKEEIRQVAAEAAKEEVETGRFQMPEWTERIKLSGDLRLRHDTQWRTERDPGAEEEKYKRNRERFRLRLGMDARTTETTQVGVRLASGNGFQNTTNQSFDGHARGKDIFIDRAYASWKPRDWAQIVGGKMKNPLFTSSLVWDEDVNPEGLFEGFQLDVNDRVGLFANLGQWFIEEVNVRDSDRDPLLLAYQVGARIKPAEHMKLELGLGYYDYRDLEVLGWSNGVLRDDSEFLGYNHRTGQQMIFDRNGNLLNEFGCWELGATFSVKDLLPIPVSVFGSYIVNAKADVEDLINLGVDTGDSDPADLLAYGGDDRDTGWQIGFSLGSKEKKGDWYAKYFYQVLEDYAFPAVFVDSDFHGGGTNNRGHFLQGRYLITDHIQARATGFFTQRDDERKDGVKDEERLQVDLIFEF